MKRNREIDFLRGIAILLVLARHSDYGTIFYQAGWLGVDLFFVLSGFLISGLLFRSYRETGKVHPGRFLLRRGFKIYPSFYIYLLISILAGHFFFGFHYSTKAVLSEVFFVQNIFGGTNFHTWSIGIEEQFYLAAALGFWFAARFRLLHKPVFPAGLIVIITGMALVRLYLGLTVPEPFRVNDHYYLRIDALATGILLSYAVHFYSLETLLRPGLRKAAMILTPLLLVPFFAVSDDVRQMCLYGFTCTYLGFAGLFLVWVYILPSYGFFRSRIVGYLTDPVSFIGRISYNVYLWHLFCGLVLERLLSPGNRLLYAVLYMAASLVTGCLATLIIEKPFLRLRERWTEK